MGCSAGSLAASILLAGAVVAAAATREDAERVFLKGGDISMLTRIEELGGVYREGGEARDALATFKGHGCNGMRLRLFHTPNGKGAVCNDLAYTVKLARRIKKAGLRLLLDFHYSDTWADPGHQTTPAAWEGMAFKELEEAVFAYTRDCIAALRKAGALPEIVQLGNEITPGMLWPEGRVGGKEFNTPEQWGRLAALLAAGRRGVEAALGEGESVRFMIHIDRGGKEAVTRWFFDHLVEQKVAFDVIGLSYYPWWHGTLDDLRKNLAATATRYGKPIVVVETAYPYRNATWWAKQKNMAWPVSKAGQRAFLQELIRAVRETPGGRGEGVLWWYPEAIPVEGLRVWNGGATGLFDSEGNVLPAMGAFKE